MLLVRMDERKVVAMNLAAVEQEKYKKAWGLDDYRGFAPGENFVEVFLSVSQAVPGNSLIDFGTGTGRAALALDRFGLSVKMVDIAENCLDDSVREKIGSELLVANLWDDIDLPPADFGFCSDVMEHIPPEKVDSVLQNIAWLTKRAFFSIAFTPDHFGKVVGSPLHLTVESFVWWREKLKGFGKLLDARDLLGQGIFYVEF